MIYEPREDSYLLAECVKKYALGASVLDMGAGSGIQALTAQKYGAKSIVAVDLNLESIKILKKHKIHAIHSNLFDKIHTSFDLIIFNPPYLPDDKLEDKDSKLTTTGGKRGDEIILKFLKAAKNHLNKDGIILLLTSSLTPQNKIESLIAKLKMKSKLIASQKIFFEVLYVHKITFK